MRILQIGKTYPLIGGVDKVIFELADGLSSNKVVCDVLCAGINNKSEDIKINDFCTFFVCSSIAFISSTWISPKMIFKLRQIVNNYDIIHIHHPDPMAAIALFFAYKKGKKIILHWHSDIVKQKLLLVLYKPIQNWLLSKSSCVIVTTRMYADGSSHLKKYQYKIVEVPIGINVNYIDNEELINSLKIKFEGKKVVYSLGRLCYYKGFNFLIDAAKYLPNNYVVLIGGSGPLFNDLNNQIISNDLVNKVILLGRINDEDMSAYYQICNIFCFPSVEKTEAFGIVQVEAMYYSKPIIATQIPNSGVSWVNKHGFSGINVEPKNAIELANAIKLICENQEKESEFSKNANIRFNKEFKLDLMIERVTDCYKKVLL